MILAARKLPDRCYMNGNEDRHHTLLESIVLGSRTPLRPTTCGRDLTALSEQIALSLGGAPAVYSSVRHRLVLDEGVQGGWG